MKFVTNEPAVKIGDNLIITDLHLGIEYEFYRNGINIPSQTNIIANKIKNITKLTHSNCLIILGDIKHQVPGMSYQEMKEIPRFFDELSRELDIICIIGNHDSGLKKLVPNGIKIYPSKGFLMDEVYLLHGNSWPSKTFLKAKYILMGHNHPIIEFRDRMGYRWSERVWIHTTFTISKNLKRKIKTIPKSMPKVIILPAFNEFAGGVSITEQKGFMGPIAKFLNYRHSKLYLLDGTYLGIIENFL